MNEKENNFISAVINIQPNETNIIPFMEMLYTLLEKHFKKYELICVSNSSSSYIEEQLKKFKSSRSQINVSLICLDNRQGLEECMNAGIDLSIGDFIFEFDSCYIDYEPQLIFDIYKKALDGYDIVSAVPPQKKSRLSSRLFYKIYNHFSDTKAIMTERFRIISRRAVNRVSGYNIMVPYRKALYVSIGLETFNMLYKTIDTPSGILPNDVHKNHVALDSLILFTDIASKISLALSSLMAIFMLGTGLYTVIVYFSTHKPVEGWAPLMGLISAGFLAFFLLMTVLIKYMDLLLKLVFKKQKYMVVNISKL